VKEHHVKSCCNLYLPSEFLTDYWMTRCLAL